MDKIDFNELIKNYNPLEVYKYNVGQDNIDVLKHYKVILGGVYIDGITISSFKEFKVEVVVNNFISSTCRNLTSLQGCPKYVGKDFRVEECDNLINMYGGPEYVGGTVVVSDSLETLQGAPMYVGGDFDCSISLKLLDLIGSPEYVGGWFDCSYGKKLKSLKGCPKYVGTDFICLNCKNLNVVNSAKALSLVNVNGKLRSVDVLKFAMEYFKSPEKYQTLDNFKIKLKPLEELQ